MATLLTLLSQFNLTMKTNKTNTQMTTMVDGLMTFGATDNGLHILDFMCTECVEMEPFMANCKVQGMRDGNVYITERPRRQRNSPLFREDNSSLTLGRDGKYHFIFTMSETLVDELPEQLVLQALAIAQRTARTILKRKGRKGLVEKKSTTK